MNKDHFAATLSHDTFFVNQDVDITAKGRISSPRELYSTERVI